jgi:hypothetical protein
MLQVGSVAAFEVAAGFRGHARRAEHAGDALHPEPVLTLL